jgi:hypothetical protein
METCLEKQQSESLYQVVKEKYKKTNIKDIDEIIHHMSKSLYHDKRVNDIYSKTAISRHVLHKLFIRENADDKYKQDVKKEYERLLEDANKTINYTLEKYRPKKYRKSCCFIC